MNELKAIQPGTTKFTANGNIYRVHHDLTVNRYVWLEKLQVIAAFGGDYDNLFRRAKSSYDALNAGKIADAAVLLNGLLESVNQGKSNDDPVILKIATLFLSKNDETIADWSESWASSVIDDIAKEGYSMSDFFSLALECQRAYADRLQYNTETYSKTEQ